MREFDFLRDPKTPPRFAWALRLRIWPRECDGPECFRLLVVERTWSRRVTRFDAAIAQWTPAGRLWACSVQCAARLDDMEEAEEGPPVRARRVWEACRAGHHANCQHVARDAAGEALRCACACHRSAEPA
jgi:hypothetical protein